MTKYQRKPEGTRYNPAYGRIMTHEGYATRIFWSKAMIDYLRRHFATTLNDELAGCLGVSRRTMIRKAPPGSPAYGKSGGSWHRQPPAGTATADSSRKDAASIRSGSSVGALR